MEVSHLKRLLIRNTIFQAIGHVISLGIGLATTILLSRYLSVERFGQFNYIFAFFYLFLSINDFGVNNIVVREISKQRERANEIIGGMLSFKLLLSIGFVWVAWGTIWFMNFPDELKNALFAYALILPLMALQLPALIFQVLLKMEYPALVAIVSRTMAFLLSLIVIRMGYGLVPLVVVLLLAEFAFLVVIRRYTQSFVQPILRFDPKLWKEILRFSIPLGVIGLFVALINRIDFIMLERMTDMRQVGLYSAAYKVSNLTEIFPLIIMMSLFPLMSRYAQEDVEKLRDLHKKSILYLGIVALPLGIGVTILAPFIVRLLFGAPFVDAAQGLKVLIWSSVFLYLTVSSSNLLISMGHEKINLMLSLIGAGLNMTLNFLFIPSKGFVGAALATTGTYFFLWMSYNIAVYRVLFCLKKRSRDPLHGKWPTERLLNLTFHSP